MKLWSLLLKIWNHKFHHETLRATQKYKRPPECFACASNGMATPRTAAAWPLPSPPAKALSVNGPSGAVTEGHNALSSTDLENSGSKDFTLRISQKNPRHLLHLDRSLSTERWRVCETKSVQAWVPVNLTSLGKNGKTRPTHYLQPNLETLLSSRHINALSWYISWVEHVEIPWCR